ncbi:alpha-ribazole phosphatase [Aurantivibrio plasticivorans]
MNTSRSGSGTTTQIDLLRHGECEGGEIFRGSTDVALSPEGLARMQRHADTVNEEWESIFTSPLIRCRHFAETIADKLNVPISVDERLREMHFGEWEGQVVTDIFQNDRERMSAWGKDPESNPPPGGEPLNEVHQRVSAFLSDIQETQKGRKVLVVTHGGVIRVALSQVLSMPLIALNKFEVPYACVSRVAHFQSPSRETLKLLAHNWVS